MAFYILAQILSDIIPHKQVIFSILRQKLLTLPFGLLIFHITVILPEIYLMRQNLQDPQLPMEFLFLNFEKIPDKSPGFFITSAVSGTMNRKCCFPASTVPHVFPIQQSRRN